MALGSGNLPFPLKGKGEGSNQKGSNQKTDNNNNNNNGAFHGGGPERGNPAMTAKRLRQGVKETLNINVVGTCELGGRIGIADFRLIDPIA